MSEETKVPDVPETPEAPQDDVNSEQKGILRDLQAERAKRQDLQKQLEDRIKADEEAETARLTEQQKFQELYEAEKAKVAEYEPVVENYNTYMTAKKTALLEQLGDDADDFSGLDVPALEKVVAKITKLSNAPSEPGKPGMSPSGEFGGFKTMDELASAVSRGVPGARESWDRIRGA